MAIADFFIREKPDGRRGPGYLVYLLGGLAAVGGTLYLHRRTVAASAVPARSQRARPSNVAPITQPAAVMAKVSVAGHEGPSDPRSLRLAPPPVAAAPTAHDPAAGGFNPIHATLESPSASGDEGAAVGAAPAFAGLAPAFLPDPAEGRSPGSGRPATAAQPDYRDPTADSASRAPARAPAGSAADASDHFLPRGTLIEVYMLTTVDSGNPAAIVQFGAARNLIFNHRLQIPYGTRFLGKLSGRAGRDRLNLAADTILYPDGLELPVSASAVEADESGANLRPGLEAHYIPPPAWAEVAPYVSDFVTGYLGLLGSRSQAQLAIGLNGVSVQAGSGADPRAPLYQASAQAIQDFTQARLKEIEQRHAGIHLVPAGTACWLQLDADLDLSLAHAPHRVVVRKPDHESGKQP